MYEALLFIHSWLRWVVLALALVNIYQSFIGQKGGVSFEKKHNTLSVSFMGLVHLSALTGLVLYFFYSPFGMSAFGGDVSPMKNAGIRFWAVEHIFMMLLAVTAITIGRVKSKKQSEDKAKFKIQFIWYTIGLVLILSRIPWSEAGRLFRF